MEQDSTKGTNRRILSIVQREGVEEVSEKGKGKEQEKDSKVKEGTGVGWFSKGKERKKCQYSTKGRNRRKSV